MENKHTTVDSKLSWLLLVMIALLILQGCQKPIEIPAKRIEGTWTAALPAYIFSVSDSCTSTYARYDSTLVIMRWDISYTQDNLVDIVVSTNNSEPIVRKDSCSLPPQYAFPENYHGVVGANELIVEKPYTVYDTLGNPSGIAYTQVADLNVTDNSITGTISYKTCDTRHCYGYETNANACALKRR